MQHGKDCEKVPHTGDGYLHAEDDDTPYGVDSVMYCGRCHVAIANHCSALPIARKTRASVDLGGGKSLGRMLNTARASRSWSLSEAAELLGTTKAHLHSMEAGASANPTLKMVAAFVIVYGLRPEALVATAISDAGPLRRRFQVRSATFSARSSFIFENTSAGVRYPRILRGRLLRASSMVLS